LPRQRDDVAHERAPLTPPRMPRDAAYVALATPNAPVDYCHSPFSIIFIYASAAAYFRRHFRLGITPLHHAMPPRQRRAAMPRCVLLLRCYATVIFRHADASDGVFAAGAPCHTPLFSFRFHCRFRCRHFIALMLSLFSRHYSIFIDYADDADAIDTLPFSFSLYAIATPR
jgi:hypothetical protein